MQPKIQTFFVISGKYCQSFGLDAILLHLHMMASQTFNLSMLSQYFIVIQFLSHQPG